MGIFNAFSKKQKVEQPVNIDENYYQPVEEIADGIPVGSLKPIQEEPQSTLNENEDLNQQAENLSPILVIDDKVETKKSVNSLLGISEDEEVRDQHVVNDTYYVANIFDSSFEKKEEKEKLFPMTEERLEEQHGPSRFFDSNDVPDNSFYQKQPDNISPISGTTSIFNIGMISTNTDNDKECPVCFQKNDENSEVCMMCGYVFGRQR